MLSVGKGESCAAGAVGLAGGLVFWADAGNAKLATTKRTKGSVFDIYFGLGQSDPRLWD